MGVKLHTVHTEPRLIAGVFREALLTGREILLMTEHERVWTSIKDIVETSARDRESFRKLVVKINISEQISPEVLIPFGRFVFRGKLKSIGEKSQNTYLFPESLTQETQRRFERFKITAGSSWSKITLVQEDLTIVGDFCPEDIGFDSIKGLLTIPSEIRLRQEAVVVGSLSTEKGVVKINGKIVRATEVVSGEEQVFRIVIRQLFSERTSKQQTQGTDDRRSEKRFPTVIDLQLTSEFIEKQINLRVCEVTSTTIRGTIPDSLQVSGAIFGVEYKVSGQEILLHLIANRGEEFVFEILSSDENSSKWWFNVYSSAVQPTLYSDPISTTDILRLFCEAGAFSTNYIRGSKLNVKNIEHGFSSAQSVTWLHRWIEVKEGKFTGYVSAINLMKSVWFIGDLVGGQSEENKISPQFMSSFFYAFTRFLKAFKPDHLILMTWLKDHPYWKVLQALIESSKSNVLSELTCTYTRITGEDWAKRLTPNAQFEISAVAPADVDFQKEAFEINERLLAKQFIAASASAAAKRIHRDLGGAVTAFRVLVNGSSIFCFYIDVQEGASINKFPQSIFVFDPKLLLDENNWIAIRGAIVTYCNQRSLYPASIRRISKKSVSKKFDGESAVMSLYLVTPELFDAYS